MGTCDMVKGCKGPLAYIDHKGFAYCTEHGKERQAYCRTRRMRPWEVKLIATGTPLPSYKPISQTEGMNRLRKLGYAV